MSTTALESFIKKYQTAKNHNSKEIRLTIQEAETLSIALAQILASTAQYQSQIIELQQKLLNDKNEIIVSGGAFS